MSLIVCDSSSLISLSETCNIEALAFLHESGARFLIPPSVERELVDRPLELKQYAFSAIRLKHQLEEKVLEVKSVPGLEEETHEILKQANNLLSVGGRPLKILHEGEAQCLALLKKGVGDAFLVDEKTTRLLIESPQKLAENLKPEYARKVFVNNSTLTFLSNEFQRFSVLRSVELLAVAVSKGFFKEFGAEENKALNAGLYALRRAGCSVSSRELAEYEEIR